MGLWWSKGVYKSADLTNIQFCEISNVESCPENLCPRPARIKQIFLILTKLQNGLKEKNCGKHDTGKRELFLPINKY